MKPNQGIFEDGQEAAFLHGEPPDAHDYHHPGLSFHKWSWLSGYVDGLRMKIEMEQIQTRGVQPIAAAPASPPPPKPVR